MIQKSENSPLRREDHRSTSEVDSSEQETTRGDRIRQIQNICWLLDREVANEETSRSVKLEPRRFRANPFLAALSALFTALLATTGLLLWLGLQSSLQRVPDYRWGGNYDAVEASDSVISGDFLYLATRGGGVHVLDKQTHFFRQITSASTSGGLLSNNVLEIQSDQHSRLLYLCEQEQTRGLCVSDASLSDWQTWIDINRFPGLTEQFQEQITDVVLIGEDVWFATRDAGIGVYSPRMHSWSRIFKASPDGLLSDTVWDFELNSTGELWIATAAGLNLLSDGNWTRFLASDGLLSDDIRQLQLVDDELWYLTAQGGIGRLSGETWQIVRDEQRWGTHEDDDIAAVSETPGLPVSWWIDRQGEVAAYERETAAWKVLGKAFDDREVTSFQVGPADNSGNPTLWIGTDSGLLAARPEQAGTLEIREVFAGTPVRDVQTSAGIVAALLEPEAGAVTPELQVSVDAGQWEQRLGPESLTVPAAEIRGIALDRERQLVWMATRRGLFPYSLQHHNWKYSRADGESSELTGRSVRSTTVHNRDITYLNDDAQLERWNPDTNAPPEKLLGAGKFPTNLTDITAIARDHLGRLWIGTAGHGLHVYSETSRSWQRVSLQAKLIQQIVVSSRNVWVLADGGLRVARNADPATLQIVPGRGSSIREIFAHPETDQLIVLGTAGDVVLIDSGGQAQNLVGPAASGFDPTAPLKVGVLPTKAILFAGEQNWIYSPITRGWRSLTTAAPISKIVKGGIRLWALQTNGAVVAFDGEQFQEVRESRADPVQDIAVRGEHLVMLHRNGGLQSLDTMQGNTTQLLSPADGPVSSELNQQGQLIAVNDDLFLTTGTEQALWSFNWSAQKWSRVTQTGQALQGVTQLLNASDAVYALSSSDGGLYRIPSGKIAAEKIPVPEVVHISASETGLLRTDRSNEVHRLENGVWKRIRQSGNSGLRGAEKLTDVVQTEQGLLLSTERGTALLGVDLNSWTPIGSGQVFTELRTDSAGKRAWGRTAEGQLAVLDQQNHQWLPVQLDRNETVQSFSVAETQPEPTLWATTNTGTLYRVQREVPERIWQATRSREDLSTALAVVPVGEGFLSVFASGQGSLFDVSKKSWTSLPLPGQPRQCLFWETRPMGTLALLDQLGQLHVAPAELPLQWKLLAANVTQIAVADQQLMAISQVNRSLTTWTTPTEEAVLYQTTTVPERLNRPVAVAELPPADSNGAPQLVVAGSQSTVSYDLLSRSWSDFPVSLRKFHRDVNTLWAETTENRLVKFESINGQVRLTAVESPAIARTAIRAGKILAKDVNQRIGWVGATGDLEVVIGNQLPQLSKEESIRSLTSDGTHLFLSTNNKRVFRYAPQSASWTALPTLDGCSNLRFVNGLGWMSRSQNDRELLSSLSLPTGDVRPVDVAQGFSSWRPTPQQTVVVTEQSAADWRIRELDPQGQVQQEYRFAAGPSAADVLSCGITPHSIFMLTRQGALFRYDVLTRNWSRLMPATEVESFRLYDTTALARTRTGALFLLRQDPDEGVWNAAQLAEDGDQYDMLGNSIAWTDATTLHIADLNELLAGTAVPVTRELAEDDFPGWQAASASQRLILSESIVFLSSGTNLWRLPQTLQGAVQTDAIACRELSRSGLTVIAATPAGVLRFEEEQWQPISGVYEELSTAPVRSRIPVEGTLQIPYPTGPKTAIPCTYRAGWFDIFLPQTADRETDFAFLDRKLLLVTQQGLLAIDSDSIQKLDLSHPVTQLRFGLDDNGSPMLLATDGAAATRLDGSSLQSFPAYRAAFARFERVELNGAELKTSLEVGGTSALVQLGEEGPQRRLQLSAGGFEDDQVLDMAADDQQFYLLSSGGVWSLDPETWSRQLLPSTNPAERPSFAGARLLTKSGRVNLRTENRWYLIENQQLHPLESAPAESPLILDGDRWSIRPQQSETFAVTYRTSPESQLQTTYLPGSGLQWDVPVAVAGSLQGFLLKTADGQTWFGERNSAGNSLLGWRSVGVQDWSRAIITGNGEIWGQFESRWAAFNPVSATWETPGPLPDKIIDELNVLARTPRRRWKVTDSGFALQETPPGNVPIVTDFNAQGASPQLQLLAVVPSEQGLWWVTKGALRLVNEQGEVVRQQAWATPPETVNLRRSQQKWFLEIAGSEQRSVLRFDDQNWEQVAIDETPFATDSLVLSQPQLRIVRRTNGLELLIRPQSRSNWISAEWQSQNGNFAFQETRRAFEAEGNLLVETAAGILVWSKQDSEYQLNDWQPQLSGLTVSAAQQLYASDENDRAFRFDRQQGWVEISNTLDRTLLGRSKRWEIRRNGAEFQFQVSLGEQNRQTSLRLATAGGFEHRRATHLVVLEETGNLFVGGHNTIAEFGESSVGNHWELQNHWSIVDADPAKRLDSLIEQEGTLIARVGTNTLEYSNGQWGPLQNLARLRSAQDQLWKDDVWTWHRDPQSGLRGERLIAAGEPQVFKFHATAGRFERDIVAHVGLSAQNAWLSTSTGVQAVRLDQSVVTDFPQLDECTFAWLPTTKELVSLPVDAGEVSRSLVDGDAPQLATTLPLDDAETIRRLRTSTYFDDIWDFQPEEIHWRSQVTELHAGEFSQDLFSQLLHAGEYYYLPTAIGVNVYQQLANRPLQFERIIPLPANVAEQDFTIDAGNLTARLSPESALVWSEADQRWNSRDPLPEIQEIGQLNEWRLSKDEAGTMSLQFSNVEDRYPLTQIISAQGRFLFDEMDHQLLLDDGLWLAGAGGVCVRNPENGEIVRWWPADSALNGGDEKLGRVERLGGFPLDPEAEQSVIRPVIQNLDGRIRAFDPASGSWEALIDSPWLTPEGTLLSRTSTTDVVLTPAGETRMLPRNALGESGPMFTAGRFTSDISHQFLVAGTRFWRATPAGVVVAETSTPHESQLLLAAGNDPRGLSEVEALTVSPESGMLLAVLSDGRTAELVDENVGFAPARTVAAAVVQSADKLVNMEFWEWSKWRGRVDVVFPMLRGRELSSPLVTGERWSFDAVHSFRVDDEQIWVSTPVGMLQLDPQTRSYRQWHPEVFDEQAQQSVPWPPEVHFTRGKQLRGVAGESSYLFDGTRWVRDPQSIPASNWQASTSGNRTWDVLPVDGGGLSVRLLSESGNLLEQHEILTEFTVERLRDVESDGNHLWITMDRGLYLLKPSTRIR